MRKLVTIEEIKEWMGKELYIVYDNFDAIYNAHSFDEQNRMRKIDNGYLGYGPRHYLEIEEVYDMKNGYYMTIDKFGGTIHIIVENKTIKTEEELTEILQELGRGKKCSYEDKKIIIDHFGEKEIILPTTESVVRKTIREILGF